MLAAIATVAGLWSGTVSILVGTILAYAVRPPIFLGLDFLPALVNVSIVALVVSKRLRIAQALYLLILLAFVVSPYSLLFGYYYIPYTWLHIVALAVMLSPVGAKIPDWLIRKGVRQLEAIGILAFFGTMAQHLTGGLLYELTAGYLGGISPQNFVQFWRIIFWLYPIERILIVAGSTLIATTLYRSLKKAPYTARIL